MFLTSSVPVPVPVGCRTLSLLPGVPIPDVVDDSALVPLPASQLALEFEALVNDNFVWPAKGTL
jgi:hypothetical protein